MRTKIRVIVLSLCVFALMGASCAKKAETPGETSKSDDKKTAFSDTCGNPYYPFKPGLTIAYSVTPTAGAEGSSDYTTRVMSVSGTTAKVQTELVGGVTADMEADCASGSVAMTGSSGLGAAMQDMKFKTTVLSSSGTSMPANVSAGTTWNHSETIKMEVTGGQAALTGSTITMTTTEESKASGEESITVPAGTYKAMKIELKRTTEGEMTGVAGPNGIKIPTSTHTSTEWWVKGIGMVKTITVSTDGTSTTVAKSVTGQ